MNPGQHAGQERVTRPRGPNDVFLRQSVARLATACTITTTYASLYRSAAVHPLMTHLLTILEENDQIVDLIHAGNVQITVVVPIVNDRARAGG